MPFKIFWNNKTIIHPGSYTVVDVSALKNTPISQVGVLCLLGTAPKGEPLVPLVFTNSYDIKQYFGDKSTFAEVADIVFKPSNDARVGSPTQVVCIKVNNSTQGWKEDSRFRVTSKIYGRYGKAKRVEWLLNDSISGSYLIPGSPNTQLIFKTYDLNDSSLNKVYILNENKLKITNKSNEITDPNAWGYGGLYFYVYKTGYKLYLAASGSDIYPDSQSKYIELDTSNLTNLKDAVKVINDAISSLGIQIDTLSPDINLTINDLDDYASWDKPIRIAPGESMYTKAIFKDILRINDPSITIEVLNKRIEFSAQGVPGPAESGSMFTDQGGFLHESVDNPGVESVHISLNDLVRAHDVANSIQSSVIVPLWDSPDMGYDLQMGTWNPDVNQWNVNGNEYTKWLAEYKNYIEKRNGMFDSNEVFTVIGYAGATDYNSLKDFITLSLNSPYFAVTVEKCKLASSPNEWQSSYVTAAIIGSLITSLPLGTSLTYKSVNITDIKMPFDYNLNKMNLREDLILIGHLTIWKNFKTGLFQIAKGNTSYTADDNDGFTDIAQVNLGLFLQKDFNLAFMELVGQDISYNTVPGRIYPLLNPVTIKSMAIKKFEQWINMGLLTGYVDPITKENVPPYRNLDVKIESKRVEFSAILTTITGADWLLNRLYITLPKG